MSRSLLTQLYNKVRPGQIDYLRWLSGTLSGLSLVLLFQAIALALQSLMAQSSQGQAATNVRWLLDPAWYFGETFVPLWSSLVFLSIAMVAAIVHAACWSLTLHRASAEACHFSRSAYRALFLKSRSLASPLGVSGQQETLKEAIRQAIPKAAAILDSRFRLTTRYWVQIGLSILIALAIHPVVCLLGMICLALSMQLYRWLDLRQRMQMPVVNERKLALLDRFQELCIFSPLLSSIQSKAETEAMVDEHLRTLHQNDWQAASALHRKTPWLMLAYSTSLFLLGVAIAIRMASEESHMTISGAFAIISQLLISSHGWIQIRRAYRQRKDGEWVAEELLRFLNREDGNGAEPTSAANRLVKANISLQEVQLQDFRGRTLLDDLSLDVPVGKISAIIATDPLQARAVAELILGFGRPSKGKLLIDGQLSPEFNPLNSPNPRSIWIAPDGPLIAGTIEDNLHSNGKPRTLSEIMEAVKRAGMYDAVQNLVDGLATLVAPNDARLEPDQKFRLGLARALLRNPNVVVAEEPSARVPFEVETANFNALKELTAQGCAVVVLPNRLETLRHADQIFVLHDHRVSDTGTHQQLLEKSELYRHLNYVRFSPMRHIRG